MCKKTFFLNQYYKNENSGMMDNPKTLSGSLGRKGREEKRKAEEGKEKDFGMVLLPAAVFHPQSRHALREGGGTFPSFPPPPLPSLAAHAFSTKKHFCFLQMT